MTPLAIGTTYKYDNSFEGLLSCIFAIYKNKSTPEAIINSLQPQTMLFAQPQNIQTDDALAARVLEGVNARTNGKGGEIIYKMFLSELPNIEMDIFYFIRAVTAKNDPSILENFANPAILKAAQIQKMIHREVHRMHAFVRFQKAREGIFYAAIEPDFNVLPLIGEHFERRYADQPWLILDIKRHYGVYYDLTATRFVSADDPICNLETGHLQPDLMDDKEKIYQALWTRYFKSVDIQERKNLNLHLRHVPRRYWKHLIEKRHG